MDAVKTAIDFVYKYIWEFPEAMPYFVVLLLGTGIFLTIRMRFIQLRKVAHSIAVIAGHYDDPKDTGEINQFQALTSALSATIGIGNIAGVATAIHYGGPGALFWMWVTAIFGTTSKFVECTLSTHFRRVNEEGVVSGGPMYYIEKGLGNRWKFLAVMFAACAVISSFGSGNSVQAFTVADSFRSDFGIPTWVTGAVMAILVALVIIGGIKRIGMVTSRLVPFMASSSSRSLPITRVFENKCGWHSLGRYPVGRPVAAFTIQEASDRRGPSNPPTDRAGIPNAAPTAP